MPCPKVVDVVGRVAGPVSRSLKGCAVQAVDAPAAAVPW